MLYSDNQKTVEFEDNFRNQIITLKSPMSSKHNNYAV